jgi:hypothetical protein
MAERKNTHGLTVSHRSGCAVIDIGSMEIWDGADLSLIRDTLTRLVVEQRKRSVGIDMSSVKYVPSGFFGMLFDWFEQDISVRLFSPQPRVTNMIWFKRFFEAESDEIYYLTGQHADYAEPEIEDEPLEAEWLEHLASELSSVRM